MKTSLMDKLVNALCEALPDCRAIYCFGSWGTPDQKPGSDIDLAVLPDAPLEPVRCWELAQLLASLADRDVDVVDLMCASTVMRMQVVSGGNRLYCADFYEVELFEDTAFSSYARLNEERREILDDVRQRGSVYGK